MIPNLSDYTLWLIPSKPGAAQLRKRIASLARYYRTPVFVPHVTLASCNMPVADILTHVRETAKRVAPFVLRCTALAHSGRYFRCVYARVTAAPPLPALHRDICLRLRTRNTPYEPHISLVYGNLTREQREECIRRIRMCEGRNTAGFLNTPIKTNTIAVVKLARHPKDWQTIAKVTLTGSH